MQNEVKSLVRFSEFGWGWCFSPNDNLMNVAQSLGIASPGPCLAVGRRGGGWSAGSTCDKGQPQAIREGHCPGTHMTSLPEPPGTTPGCTDLDIQKRGGVQPHHSLGV